MLIGHKEHNNCYPAHMRRGKVISCVVVIIIAVIIVNKNIAKPGDLGT